MGRMLSALQVLDRRARSRLAAADAGSISSHLADPGLPAKTAGHVEPDREPGRIEADLSLAQALLADEVFGEARSNRAPARACTPIWNLPLIDPAPDYLDLALRLAREAGIFDGQAPILLTAVGSGSKHEFNVLELAVALGGTGGDVLCIDLQRSIPHGVPTGPDPQDGLNQVLSNRATWSDVIRPTTLPGISFVGVGRPEPAASSWQAQAGRIWQQLPGKWRQVLVYSEMPSQPIAHAMAAVCRSTYLIVELTQDRTGAVSSALSALRSAGANLCGVVALDARRPRG